MNSQMVTLLRVLPFIVVFCVFVLILVFRRQTLSTQEISNQQLLLCFSHLFFSPRGPRSPGDGTPASQAPWLLPPKEGHPVATGSQA